MDDDEGDSNHDNYNKGDDDGTYDNADVILSNIHFAIGCLP